MNQKLIRLQLLGCGLLSLCLAAEWSYSRFSADQLRAILAPRDPAEFQAEELPSISDSEAAAENYSEIVERPVFVEGRRPLADVSPIESAQNQDAGQIDDWALVGIYNKDKRPTALFSKRNEARKFMKITEEQTISGWQLKKIHSDRVELQQAGQQKSVALRKPRAQVKPPATGRPPAPPRPPQPNAVAKPIEQVPNEIPENPNDSQ